MTTFKKGYAQDVGIDICLDHDVTFEPFETKVINIGVNIPTRAYRSIMMCARTSAAKQGIIVNQCPIDPNYEGPAHIIAHNLSRNTVTFEAGQAFAQIYAFDCQDIAIDYIVKKRGIRNFNNFGSTDKEIRRNDINS